MLTFGTNDTYKVSYCKKNEKINIDQKVLLRLYAPLIGSAALSLYLVLDSELSLSKNKSNAISRLTKINQFTIKQFNEAIDMLVSYNMLEYKSNAKKANDYKFILHSTLSANEFFNNEKFNEDLIAITDATYYQQVTDYFMSFGDDDDEDYVDINTDVNCIKNEDYVSYMKEKNPILGNLINESNNKELLRLIKLFKLSYDDFSNCIINAINGESIDVNKLNDYLNEKYSNKEETKEDKYIKSFESMNCISYYKKLSGREALFQTETSVIESIQSTYNLSDGFLNVVIDYCYRKTNALNKTYLSKVIESMIISGANVASTSDAMKYFKNIKKKIETKNDIKPAVKKEENNNAKASSKKEKLLDELNEFLKDY